MSCIQNIILKYEKIKTILVKINTLTTSFDSNNIDIIKAYIITLIDFYNEIDRLVNEQEYILFSTMYNFTWFNSTYNIFIKTLKVNDYNTFYENVITGLYLYNSNNVNNKNTIKNWSFENKQYITDYPINFNVKYIENYEKNLTSAFNIHGDSILYLYMNIKSLKAFADSYDINVSSKFRVFNECIQLLIENLDKYLLKLNKFYELHQLRHN